MDSGWIIIRASHGVTSVRQIDAGTTSGEGNSTLGAMTLMTWDAVQIERRVSVHQGSLILEACRHVRRACVRKEMECEATRSHCEQPTGAESRVRSARGEIQTVGCEAKYACGRPERA